MASDKSFQIVFWLGFLAVFFGLLLKIKSLLILGSSIIIILYIGEFNKKRFAKKWSYLICGLFSTALLVIAYVNKYIAGLIISTVLLIITIALYIINNIKHKRKSEKPLPKSHKLSFRPNINKLIKLFLITALAILLIIGIIKSNTYLIYLVIIIAIVFIISRLYLHLKNIKIIKDFSHIKIKKDKEKYRIKQMQNVLDLYHQKYKTDLDMLYELSQKFENIKLSEISAIFNIDIKKAAEWCKILEEHNLGHLHYPAVGEPELQCKK